MKKLFIIRHGETEFNRLNIVQGSGVDTDLNDLGMQQAEAFYKYYRHHPFEHVFTSTLKRSNQSVAAFIENGIPHTRLAELNEISWGDFEGKQQTPEQKAMYWEMIYKWNEGDLHAKIPNGESPFEMQQRQKRALKMILNQPESEILICMHGRAMKSFLCLLLNQPLTQMEQFQHRNLCLYEVHIDTEECHLKRANDVTHLLHLM
ncbi:MAG: histidine phosphatase family protein [Bacteroidota bacterium]|jgi:broad specificity phosphatase PhoE|nr:histidine phosphatase family protein [Sphingobacteriales bacterium]